MRVLRRSRLVHAGLALAGLGVALPAAAATTSGAPPLTSLKICELFPATVVKAALASSLLPVAGYNPAAGTTLNSYATCFYHFANAYYVEIEFYGPPHAKAATHGARLAALGPTGRHYADSTSLLVTAFVKGYDVTLAAPKHKVAAARLFALGAYVVAHVP